MGARTGKEHFLNHDPEKFIYMTTDDGSLGIKGTVIDALNLLDDGMHNKKIFLHGE